MNQVPARRLAKQYRAHGIAAIARTKGNWPAKGEEWFVCLRAADKCYYEQHDMRVTEEFNRFHDALKEGTNTNE